jgi:hypothetical protein
VLLVFGLIHYSCTPSHKPAVPVCIKDLYLLRLKEVFAPRPVKGGTINIDFQWVIVLRAIDDSISSMATAWGKLGLGARGLPDLAF